MKQFLVRDRAGKDDAIAPQVVARDHGAHRRIIPRHHVDASDEDEPAVLKEWRKSYYGGNSIASVLARQGYVVLVIDMFYWGERRMLLDDDFVGYPLLKSFLQVPFTVKTPATTQVDPNMAVDSKYQQKGIEHVVQKKLGQGKGERLHPGTPTFGHSFEDYQDQANKEKVTTPGDSEQAKSAPEK